SGIVDLLAMELHGADGTGPIPEALGDTAAAAHARLVEAVAETDDALLEQYLEAGELSDEQVRAGLLAAVAAGRIVPVLAGSATRPLGALPLLRAIAELLPPPTTARVWEGRDLASGEPTVLEPSAEGPFAALVFKT